MGDNTTSILPITAMAFWDNKLVVGTGSDAGTQGNLAYFDKTVSTEMGHIVTGAYETAHTIASELQTKMFDAGMPTTAKRLERVTLVYYDSTAWNSMTMSLYYRYVKVTVSTSVVGGSSATTDWALVSGAAITLDVQTGVSYRTMNVGSDPGHAFQFKITFSGFAEILGLIPEFSFESERQQ
jgi:hypothetical protein